jgi:hypothetical protein
MTGSFEMLGYLSTRPYDLTTLKMIIFIINLTKEVAVMVMFETCIPYMLGLNLGQDTIDCD